MTNILRSPDAVPFSSACVGLDEVGYGALAGPIAVCGVRLDPDMCPPLVLRDSKKMTQKAREEIWRQCVQPGASWLTWALVFIAPGALHQGNPLQLTLKAMALASETLGARRLLIDGVHAIPSTYFQEKMSQEALEGQGFFVNRYPSVAGRTLISGNFFCAPQSGHPEFSKNSFRRNGHPEFSKNSFRRNGHPEDFGCNPPEQHTLVKGDTRSAPIALASVLAKVSRDHIMRALHQVHPSYGWASNKGYAVQEHVRALKALGLSDQHREKYCKNIIALNTSDVCDGR